MSEWNESDLELREALVEDLPDMARLFTKRKPKERETRMIERYAKEPNGWYVAIWEGEVVGCCQAVFPLPTEAWLQWMRIAPEMQGTGVGAALIRYVEQQTIADGAQVIRLSTALDNDRVHAMMGGARGYTEWVRWTRLTRLQQEGGASLLQLRRVEESEDEEKVLHWLRGQVGYQQSFRTVTCPNDYKKFVSLEALLAEERPADRAEEVMRPRMVLVRSLAGNIEAVVFYVREPGELRILQVVATSTSAALAGVSKALANAEPKDHLLLQASGLRAELLEELQERLKSKSTRRHDFYVFGKRVAHPD